MASDNPPPTSGESFYARTFALVALAVIGLLLYRIVSPFFTALAWALFIAFLLTNVHDWLVGRLRGRENLSASLLTVSVLVVILGPLTALGAAFGVQAADLLQYMRGFAEQHREFSDLESAPVIGAILAWAQESFGVSLGQIQTWVEDGARRVLQPLAALGGRIFLGTLGTVVNFVLMLFLLFFMIRDRPRIVQTLSALVPLPLKERNRLLQHLASVTRAIVYGTGVTAIVQGILVGIGFAIVGLPSPLVFGVLAALAALIPMAGTPVVWVPAAIVLAVQQRWIAMGFLIGWGLMVATIDNVLRPWLAAGRAQVSALTVFIGVLGGVSAFGATGLFLGPLILALVTALVRFAVEVRQTGA